MRENFLPFSPPWLGEEEIAEVVDTLRTDWISTGPKTKRFEEEFSRFIGCPAALAVSSATDALQVGLAALGVAPGDEVITSVMTFCSTVHVIEHLGAKPVLVDVESDTLNMDPAALPAVISPRTKVILPVHLYGHPCDMSPICQMASEHGLRVLEDAAHALPAKYGNQMIGRIGDLTAFSFYATKNLTTGEGGMLVGDQELIDRARLWSLHGMSRDAYRRYSQEGSWFYEVVLPGFKCNMSDILAAIGIQQLKKLPAFQARRGEIAERYEAALSRFDEIQIPVCRPGVTHSWHLYAIRLKTDWLNISRNEFIDRLKRHNIGASVHFIPVHLHPYYRDKYSYRPEDFPTAFDAYNRLISLPLYPRMTDQDVEDVISAVSEIVNSARK